MSAVPWRLGIPPSPQIYLSLSDLLHFLHCGLYAARDAFGMASGVLGTACGKGKRNEAQMRNASVDVSG